jgi:predicted dehydrogenase
MRIGIVGLGFMGSTHVKGLQQVNGAVLRAVVERDPVKRSGDMSAIQGNLGGPGETFDFSEVAQYATFEELLADPNIDAVDLCVPTHVHKPLAIAALRAGKHVLVEKPMALNEDECAEMILAAEQAGKTLMVAQVLRFFPAYTAVRTLIDTGKLGRIRSAFFRRRCAAPAWSKWLKDASASGGGVFDLLIHDIDMALHLFGKPCGVSATGYEDLAAGLDTITANFYYENIPSVIITGGWHHPKSYPFSMEYTISADGGTLDYSTDGRPPTLYLADGSKEALELETVDGYTAELQYFADCVNDGTSPAICLPADSALAVQSARRMVDSRSKDGARIDF